MLRKWPIAVALAGVLAVAMPSPAPAQTLLPPIPGAGKKKESRPDRPKHDSPRCLPGVSLLCAAEDLGSGAVDVIGGAVGAGAGVAANAVMDGIVGWAASGAAWLVKSIADQVDRSTRPALGSAWFGRQYGAMRQLAISLSVLFLLMAVAQAVARRDLTMLLRSCLVALPLALLLTFAAVTLVELGLALTDALTVGALRGAGGDVKEGFSDLAEVLVPAGAATGNALPGLVLFLGALLTAVLALVVWIELILREAAIYVALAFLPITLAAAVWPPTTQWARRLAQWLSAIVLAKFTIAVSFGIAGSMVAHARGGSGGLSALLAGCAVLLLAAFSPWVLLRLIPFAEQAAGSLHRGHLGGAVKAAPGAHVTTLLVHQAMLKNFGAGLAAGGGRARSRAWTPAPLAPQPAAFSPVPRSGQQARR